MTTPDLFSPGLHPGSSLPPYVQASERKFHEALATAIHAGWSAWHSLKIRKKSGQFSEADFVIADPSRGILVLEVKGGIVRKQDGVWFQNERPMKMPPLDQAHRFVRVLLGKYNGAGARPAGHRSGRGLPGHGFRGPADAGRPRGVRPRRAGLRKNHY